MDSSVRTKTSAVSKIICVNNNYKVEKVTKTVAYDPILHTWEWGNAKYKTEILPLSCLKPEPKKVIDTYILLLKPLLNSVEEKLIPFKQKIKIAVKEDCNSIYITQTPFGFYQNCLSTGQCAPMSFSCKNVIIERGNREEITNEQFQEVSQKYKTYHESPSGELSIQVDLD